MFVAALIAVGVQQQIACAETIKTYVKPSLKALTIDFKKNQSSKSSDSKKQKQLFENFRKQVSMSEAFIRGEIEDKSVYSGLLDFLLYSLTICNEYEKQKKLNLIQEDLSVWINFAADLAYEEASLTGMMLSHEIRLNVFDYLEEFQKRIHHDSNFQVDQTEAWLHWSRSLRIPWPADRIVMSGVSALKSPKSQYTARKAMAALQSNPYQTYAEAYSKAQGPKSIESKSLENLWTEKEINLMKSEVNRLNLIQIRFALMVFEQKNARLAQNLSELVEKKILPSIPVDYVSGKTFELSQVKFP